MPKVRSLPVGTYWVARSQKWASYIYVLGKSQYIGLFKTYTEARKAWEAVYLEWYGRVPHEDVPKEHPKATNVPLRLPYVLVSNLKTLAKESGVSYSTYVRNVLAEHIKE